MKPVNSFNLCQLSSVTSWYNLQVVKDGQYLVKAEVQNVEGKLHIG